MLDTARTAAIGHVIGVGNSIALDDGAVDIGGANDGGVHVDDGRVVGEVSAAPLAAGKADAEIAATVIDSAVVADLWSPVALVKGIEPVGPSPVAGSPIGACVRDRYPCAGNPVIVAIVVVIGPVAGSPHQVGLGADGLLVDGQRRRGKSDTDEYPGLHSRRGRQRCNCEKQKTGRSKEPHESNLLVPSGLRRREWVLRPARQNRRNYPARLAGGGSLNLVKLEQEILLFDARTVVNQGRILMPMPKTWRA
jgi:hypothetical protein